jgi:hypothetical protein
MILNSLNSLIFTYEYIVCAQQNNWKDATRQPLDPDEGGNVEKTCCLSISLTKWTKNHYSPFIMRPAIKVCLAKMINITIIHRYFSDTVIILCV